MINTQDSPVEKIGPAKEAITEKFRRYLFGEDIFISYSRHDAPTYAAGLANELAARNFSCKFDQWGTEPGRELPEPLKRALRRSAMLVLISGKAATRSSSVRKEIEEFLKTGRMIIPIDLDGTIVTAPWWGLVEGLPVSPETPDNIKKGDPSEEIINRIQKTFNFNRKDQRLRKMARVVASVVILLLLAGAAAGTLAGMKGKQAAEELAKAVDARAEADRQTGFANDAKDEARRQTQASIDAKAEALKPTQIAGEQTAIAKKQNAAAVQARADAGKQTKIAAAARVLADKATAQQRAAEAQTRDSVAQNMIVTGDALLGTKPEVAINLAYKASQLSNTLKAVDLLRAGATRIPLWFELVPPWSKPGALFIYTAFSQYKYDSIAASKKMDYVLSVTKWNNDEPPGELGLYGVPDGKLSSRIALQKGDEVITPDPLATSLVAVERKSKGANAFDIYNLDAGKIELPILEVRDAGDVKFTDGGWPVYTVGKGGEISAYHLSPDTNVVKRTEIGRWPEIVDFAIHPSKDQPTLVVIGPHPVKFIILLKGKLSSKLVNLPMSTKSRESRTNSDLSAMWGPDPDKLILCFQARYAFPKDAVYAIDAASGHVQEIYEDKKGRFDTFFRTARNGRRVVVAGPSRTVGGDSIAIIDIDWEDKEPGGGIRTTKRAGAWFEQGARSANTRTKVEAVIISANGNFLVANRSGQGTSGLTSSDSSLEYWDIRALDYTGDMAPAVINLHTNGAPVRRLAFSSDATGLLAWDAKGVVSIFRVNASATESGYSGRMPPDVASRLSPKIEPAGEGGRFRRVVYGDNDWRYFDMVKGNEIKLGELVDQPLRDSVIDDTGRALTIATDSQLLRFEDRRVSNRVTLSGPVVAAAVDSEITVVQTANELKAYDTASLQPLHSVSLNGIPQLGWIWGEKGAQTKNVWIYALTMQDGVSFHSWQLSSRGPAAGGKPLSYSKVDVKGVKENGYFKHLLGDGVLLSQTIAENAYTDAPCGRFYDAGAKTEIRLYDLTTGKDSQLLPPDNGWPTGAGSMEKLYLNGADELVVVLKYREPGRTEEFNVATWSRGGGACKSVVPLGTSGRVLLSSHVGGTDIAHLLVRNGAELLLLRISDGKVLWRDKTGRFPDVFPPIVFDRNSRSWSAVASDQFAKTVQRIFMGDGPSAFTHTPLPALLTERYSRWLQAN